MVALKSGTMGVKLILVVALISALLLAGSRASDEDERDGERVLEIETL